MDWKDRYTINPGSKRRNSKSMNNCDTKHKILVIDDEPSMLTLLQDMLDDDFNVQTCDNAKDGVQSLHVEKPSLILLDINLKDSNGLDTTKLIKNDPENKDIPIILVSGFSSKEDKAAGYEAGASDFISKPFSIEEVLHKIRINIDFHEKIAEQTRVIDETRQMAFNAMSQSGEIGQILHFMRDSFECDTFDKLGERILETMEAQSLNTVVRIHTDPPMYYSHEGEVARLDGEILDRLYILERIIDFGIRSLYNFDNISLLVKNMPLDDEAHYGRIKDNVCLVLEAADSKIKGINNALALRQRDKSLSQVITSSKKTLKDIESSFQENALKNAEIMSNLKEKIEWSFVQLGLSEEQEQEISRIIQAADESSNALYTTGLKIEDRLNELTSQLGQFDKPK